MKQLLTLVSVLSCAAAGCGTGTEQDASRGPARQASPTTAEAAATSAGGGHPAEEAYREYWSAVHSGDAERACALETDKFIAHVVSEARTDAIQGDPTTCEGTVAQAAPLIKQYQVSEDVETSDLSVDGDKATFTTTVQTGVGPTKSEITMVRDGDEWLVDDETDIAADGSTEPEAEDIDRWLSNWCDLTIGMTKEAAVEVMGAPTEAYGVADDASPQISWDQGPYQFTAFLDTDDKVRQLSGSYDALGESDKAKVPCPEFRGA